MRDTLMSFKSMLAKPILLMVLISAGLLSITGCQSRVADESAAANTDDHSYDFPLFDNETVIRPVQFSVKIHSGSSGALLPVNLKTQIAPLFKQFDSWNQITQVTITGHTDAEGSDVSNMRLSLRRAQALADQLIAQGVPEASIVVKGRGEQSPIASNTSISGRQLNRRVEVIAYGLIEEPIKEQTARR